MEACAPEDRQIWGDINRAAIGAMQNPGRRFEVNPRLSFIYVDDFLKMRLPNGREIAYPFPRLMENEREDLVVVYKDASGGKWLDCKHHGKLGLWPGGWTENAVQAIARDLFAEAMPRLEAAGYPIVLHVHDEIVAEVPIGHGGKDEFIKIIIDIPAWAAGLPMDAKGEERGRFCKIGAACASPTPALTEVKSVQAGNDVALVVVANHEPREPHDPPPKSNNSETKMRKRESFNGYASGEERTGSPAATYVYKDARGENHLRVERIPPRNGKKKQFPQSHWENGIWVDGAAATKIPYRLPELIAAAPDIPVFVCEGEKDADSVAALGFVATTNSGGAGKWTAELNHWFKDRKTVYVMEDNDPPDNPQGQRHARDVSAALRPNVGEVLVVSFPEVKDVSDYLAQGHTAEELLEHSKAGRRPLKIVGFNPADWRDDPLPEPLKQIVSGYILDETTTMFSGDGGTGKSYMAHQLTIARALKRKWIGLEVVPGKTLYLSCEDNMKEMKRREYGILQYYDAEWDDFGDDVRLVDLVGEDSILAMTKKGRVEAEPMYQALDEYMADSNQGSRCLMFSPRCLRATKSSAWKSASLPICSTGFAKSTTAQSCSSPTHRSQG